LWCGRHPHRELENELAELCEDGGEKYVMASAVWSLEMYHIVADEIFPGRIKTARRIVNI
jgi:hypothetical protein